MKEEVKLTIEIPEEDIKSTQETIREGDGWFINKEKIAGEIKE